MNIIETALPGVLIIEPKVFGDARGYFFESWNQAAYEAAGITNTWACRSPRLSPTALAVAST